MHEQGDPDGALARPDYAQDYSVAPAVHAAIETASATARYDGGKLELWIAAQAGELTRRAAAKAIGISAQDVVLYPTAAGGSFDARLERRHAIEVAQIAQQIGPPGAIDLAAPAGIAVWCRCAPPSARGWMQASCRRAAAASLPGAQLAMPLPCANSASGCSTTTRPKRRWNTLLAKPIRWPARARCLPYAIEHVAIDHLPVTLPFPTGRLRGNAAAYTAFFTESFIDELAERAGRDLFLYRIEMLGQTPRMADCLRRATRLAGWDGGRRGTGQGLAMVRIGGPDGGGRIACVAQAALGEGGLRVTRLHAAVDIGRIVNHDIARQQIEGGLIFGLVARHRVEPCLRKWQARPRAPGGAELADAGRLPRDRHRIPRQ